MRARRTYPRLNTSKPSSRNGRARLAYVVGLAGLPHIIAGSVEVLFTVATGETSWSAYLGGYMLPALIGNTIGGSALVAWFNHAQDANDSS